MAIITYSLRADRDKRLSASFTVSEFACKDGSDTVLIDEMLIAALQALRDYFAAPVTISSAYRTKAYNSSIGGASGSQHLYGTAADIRVIGVPPREVAICAERQLWSLGAIGGLGLYDYAASDKAGFVHIDTRTSNRAQWVQTKSSAPTGYRVVGSILRDHIGDGGEGSVSPVNAIRTLKKGMSGEDVAELARILLTLGFMQELAYDSAIEAAVIALQNACGLTADGVYGAKSRNAALLLLEQSKKES